MSLRQLSLIPSNILFIISLLFRISCVADMQLNAVMFLNITLFLRSMYSWKRKTLGILCMMDVVLFLFLSPSLMMAYDDQSLWSWLIDLIHRICVILAGLMATYHAKNEYCLLSDMNQGYQVFISVISQLEDTVNWLA